MNKILLWSDVPGWAFDKTADMIIKHLPDMDITKYNGPDLNGDKLAKYDRIHALNWLYGQKYAHRKGFSGGVCQHNYELKWHKEAKVSIPKFSKMVAISKEIYDDIIQLNPETYYIPNAVDETIFTPRKHKGEFTVGWCGQKTSGGFGEKKGKEGCPKWDIKGYELILQPLMECLGKKVKFKINCRNHKDALNEQEMAEWYKDIDCFICTSLFEGGPFPALEASASGKPVISTTVGIVPELIESGYNGYLIEKPTKREDLPEVINKFKQYIAYLKGERVWCVLMGKNNRREILKHWTWKKVAPWWKEFLE
ncbi:MAG: glycosyltransferase family 4 protein [bacterium]|nr:glycosyltransferase family 4 protein [bacterium]